MVALAKDVSTTQPEATTKTTERTTITKNTETTMMTDTETRTTIIIKIVTTTMIETDTTMTGIEITNQGTNKMIESTKQGQEKIKIEEIVILLWSQLQKKVKIKNKYNLGRLSMLVKIDDIHVFKHHYIYVFVLVYICVSLYRQYGR